MQGILKKLFGSRNDRLVRQYQKRVVAINALEAKYAAFTDSELREQTQLFRNRHLAGESLDKLLPEAFAVMREAGKRVYGMRHFDMQLVGGMVLHDGKIAEMRTGEGKTLTATLAVYLNALSGNPVHVVTVNDYLARRDAEWMGRIYDFLGLSVGINLSQMEHADKQQAYARDITYGTNNEFGFDYLRDNMVYSTDQRVQRGLGFAIVDEVDSILIDEARTPLIISGQADDHTELYLKMNQVPPMLSEQEGEEENVIKAGDYTLDLKQRSVLLTEQGHERAEELLAEFGILKEGESLYDSTNILLLHHLYAALRAHTLFHKDQQYVVQNGEIIIVDEFTGRLMAGRRWSDGLHQAVEAKEHVELRPENQTLASITFQNYFRMYEKLSGMTGTADTEAYEFHQIYSLETVVVPTNKPMVRKDMNDLVYRTAKEKYKAIINDIRDAHERGQPVLVGTTSIENSELLSSLLGEAQLPHQVLNAKQHEREAHIVAQAGRPGVITIATNMAGRGTDIVLGGNPEPEITVVEANDALDEASKKSSITAIRDEAKERQSIVLGAGGLKIIGTERHESRRIDNQLRGRAGRQGDVGASRFYLSLEDPLMKIFAGERLNAIMVRLKMPEDEAIEARMVTRSLESAQRKVEQRNFDIRKQLLEFDDVANDQRKVIYAQRNELLESTDVSETISAMRTSVLADLFRRFVPQESIDEQWDLPGLEAALKEELHMDESVGQWVSADRKLSDTKILERLQHQLEETYQHKIVDIEPGRWQQFECNVMMQSLDTHWREHLVALDHLRQGIHLRGYAQKNPKQEYKREAFELFEAMLDAVRLDVTRMLVTIQIEHSEELEQAEPHSEISNIEYHHDDLNEPEATTMPAAIAGMSEQHVPIRVSDKIGRNDPCPCGSGKKYKHCHGMIN